MEQFYFQTRFSARIRSKGSIAVGRLKTFALFAKNWLPRPFSARQIATFRFRPGFGRPIAQYAPRRSCFKAIMPVFSALRIFWQSGLIGRAEFISMLLRPVIMRGTLAGFVPGWADF